MIKRPNRNQLRIIGGKWRGRKIQFPDAQDLRPTPDRVRETLFNWLTGWIDGAHCLDLFAGSGALGFEAASRGASRVVLVDQDPTVIKALRDAQQDLSTDNVTVIRGWAEKLPLQEGPFDILFLDPPFRFAKLDEFLQAVAVSGILKIGAWIYLESAANRAIVVPASWRLHRHKQAGQVEYRLYRNEPQPELPQSEFQGP